MTARSDQQSSAPRKIPNYMKFILGGTAGMMATCVVQPFDVVKTRMQISGMGTSKKEYRNSFDCLRDILRVNGPKGLYLGIGAALVRQATYSTTRLGVYSYLNDAFRSAYLHDPTLLYSMTMGITAGAAGAFVGTPAEVALIRMQTDSKLPVADRRNYKNVFHAFYRITSDEGVLTLWRGCLPTVGRAMVVNMSQLASYSQFKRYFRTRLELEGIKLHFVASMLSGLITAVASMPLDIAKTRIQNMKIIDGKGEYRGTFDVLGKVARQEGFFALWKGLTPYYFRVGPHTVFLFIFLEQLNKLYVKHALGSDGGSSSL